MNRLIGAAFPALLICLGVAVMGCAEDAPSPARPLRVSATQERQLAALRPWMDCAASHLVQMDDGSQNERRLASKIADRCRAEYSSYFAVSTEGMTDAERSEARRRLANWDTDHIRTMIASRRREAAA